MNTSTGTLVKIAGKEYQIHCPLDAEGALISAASHIDELMAEIQKSGRVIGTERIAVMAALNVSHKLLSLQAEQQKLELELSERIKGLQNKLGNALIFAAEHDEYIDESTQIYA